MQKLQKIIETVLLRFNFFNNEVIDVHILSYKNKNTEATQYHKKNKKLDIIFTLIVLIAKHNIVY